jgi:hypothetical protein
MGGTFTVAGTERDWLTASIAFRFFVIDEIRLGRARGGDVGAEELAREFGDDMRLLADLGWFDRELMEALGMPVTEQGSYEATLLSPIDLAATRERLREDALAGSAHYLRPVPEVPTRSAGAPGGLQLAAQVCSDVLVRLQKREEQSL